MADELPPRSMSLVPYQPDSREIVLRHGSAIVVYDQESRQLSLKDTSRSQAIELADCPYCHRPLRENSRSPDRNESPSGHGGEASFVNPEYFRLLHHSTPGSSEPSRPPSPRRRLVQPRSRDETVDSSPPSGAEFLGSSPASPPSPHGISAAAFSKDYFKTFFVEERELGRGGKGVVLLVRHVLDGVNLGRFACKRVPVGDDHEWLEKVLVEVQLLQNLSHQNLVSYRHVWLEDYQITSFGPSVPCAFMLQQYCNAGDLHHYILNSAKSSVTAQDLKERLRRRSKGQAEPPQDLHGPRRMHFEEIFSFCKDITSGLNYLHVNGYIHRDLKPSNCLLHNDGHKTRLLVSDFGEVQSVNMNRRSTGATGTISYCAPEVLRRESPAGPFGNFTTKSDIFSLGMIVYFMCFGRSPYINADDLHEENEDLEQLRDEISAWAGFGDERRTRDDLPEKLYHFLRRLLSVDPQERPSAEEILLAIKGGAGFEDFTSYTNLSSGVQDGRSRIVSVGSPSPAPGAHSRRPVSPPYLRPGPSKLKREYAQDQRETSPSRKQSREDDNIAESSVVLRTRKTVAKPPIPPRTPSSPRLILPPPPPSPSSRLLNFLTRPDVLAVARFSLFMVKLYSVSFLCSPFQAHAFISYPLMALAAMDLVFLQKSWAQSVFFLLVHVLVVLMTYRYHVLCNGRLDFWADV
ncbi:MAG: putative serine/threonine-protein kinase iks1 [Bathelium mastoideum]|nr:MAG: putative serine/threonine-protein kinase iks1 [Bathelium mastoideum]